MKRQSDAWRIAIVVGLALAGSGLPLIASADDAIYVMRPDGKDVRRVALVAGCKGHRSPQWSHDGQRLAFDANPEHLGQGTLVRRERRWHGPEGDGRTRRAALVARRQAVGLSQLRRGGARRGIWVQNVHGGGKNWIVDGMAPRWSPDGSHIAYTDWKSIKSLDLVEGESAVLHTDEFDRVYPGFDWSPDGKRLAFVADRNKRRELIIFDGQECKVRLVRQNLDGYLGWSPDGKRMVVSIVEILWLLDPDGVEAPRDRSPANSSGTGTRRGRPTANGWLSPAIARFAIRPKPKWKNEIRWHQESMRLMGLSGRRGDPFQLSQ